MIAITLQLTFKKWLFYLYLKKKFVMMGNMEKRPQTKNWSEDHNQLISSGKCFSNSSQTVNEH